MLRSITISGLRGIKEGKIDSLTPLVVFVGPNSAGKSTILDAMYLGMHSDPSKALQILLARRPSLQQPGEWLLWRHKGTSATKATVEIASDARNGRVVTLDLQADGRVEVARQLAIIVGVLQDIPEVRLIDPHGGGPKESIEDLYSRVVQRGLRREAKELVLALLPGLEGIEILTNQQKPVLHLTSRDGAQPVGAVGDGIRLLLQQSFELASPAGGVVLLEEPEVHLHPAAMQQSAKAIWAAINRQIQVILTTHSLDFIDALLACAPTGDLEKLSICRVRLDQGQLKTRCLSGTEAATARTQIEEDLR